MRVVSLVPSVTETLLAWDVRPVAVTRFCEVPDFPTVGGTKNPDVAAIVALEPDLVVMDQEENRREDATALVAAGVTVHATQVRALADVGPTLAGLASALGIDPPDPPATPEPAEATGRPGPLIRAWVPIWRRPWMTVSGATYGSSLLAAAGFANVCAHADSPYPTVPIEEAADLQPDVVLAPSEPYPFAERHRSELEQVGPVRFVDGRDLFWWGHRSAGAVARVSDLARRVAAGLRSR